MPFCTSCGKEVAPGKNSVNTVERLLNNLLLHQLCPRPPPRLCLLHLSRLSSPVKPPGGSGKTMIVAGNRCCACTGCRRLFYRPAFNQPTIRDRSTPPHTPLQQTTPSPAQGLNPFPTTTLNASNRCSRDRYHPRCRPDL